MGSERTGRELAMGFLQSIAARDLDAMRDLLDDEAVFWTNVTMTDTDKEARLQRIAMEFRTFDTFVFVDERIDELRNGFVIRARAKGSLPGGITFEFPICIVADSRNGRICRLEEYLDPAAVTPILSALSIASPH
jgi:ketosteroid isomerase-like protein